MEILDFLFGFVCAFVLTTIMYRSHVKDMQNDFMNQLNSHRHMNILIEYVNDEIFVYNADSKEFMAKGKTRKEVEDALKSRYPNKSFIASGDDFDKLEDVK